MIQQMREAIPQAMRSDYMAPHFMSREQAADIILVDSHKLMRLALERVVTSFAQMRNVVSFSSICEAQVVIEKKDVQVIVLGPSIPVSDCLSLVSMISGKNPSCGIVVIQQCLHPETALTLVKKGVHGLLDEMASEQDLLNAIAAASIGNTFLSRRAHNILSTSMSRASIHLTQREMEVLSLLRDGKSNFRIAYALGLKEKTVEKYLTHIYDKFNVSSRAEAILYIQKMHI